ncbi:MAG: hypothetical protein AAF938_28945 [Myxococcota bacterium]
MGSQAEAKAKGPPKRRLRNYLLDPRFQVKYTSMVVVVTVMIAAVLGYFAYDYSKGQTEAMSLSIAMEPGLNPEAADDLEGFAEAEDQKVLTAIVTGIIVLALALGITGIIVTHKVVGPAYKMRLLLNEVGKGKLKLVGRLRKGDELQELFEAFADMIERLRETQAQEIAELEEAIELARKDGVSEEAIAHVIHVHDRMKAALE